MINLDFIKQKNLKRLMDERGFKNEDLAKLLNVDPSMISNLLRSKKKGSRNIGRKLLSNLCKALMVDESEFYKSNNKGLLVCEPTAFYSGSSNFNEFVIDDDLMEPLFLLGDIVGINSDYPCQIGDFCLIKIADKKYIRRYNETESEIRLSVINDKTPDMVIRKGSQIEYKIIGKVSELIRKF